MKQNSRVIVDIDVNDEVIIRPESMTEADVKKLLTDLKDNGCDTILVRMGFLGLLPYRTSLTYPMAFDSQYAREWGKDQPFISDLEKIIERNESWLKRYAKVIEAYNPPEVFLQYGHELGLKVIFWIDLYDDGFPGFKSKFIDEHPWCQWTAKDGKTYFKGLISYAWPEARAFRLEQAKELLALGADGIHCSTSAHSRHMRNVHEVDFYGYEQPVVDEYFKRYGVDISKDDDFDREAWQDIKGEMVDKLYSGLADLCHSRGKELWIGLQLGRYTQMCADPYNGSNAVARYANHWKYLVDNGVADAFIIGDFELVSFKKEYEYWQAKADIVLDQGDDLFDWIAKEYMNYCNTKTKLYLFGEWLSHDSKELDNQLSVWADRVTRLGFDGIDLHEALNVEEPEHLAIFKRFADKLA